MGAIEPVYTESTVDRIACKDTILYYSVGGKWYTGSTWINTDRPEHIWVEEVQWQQKWLETWKHKYIIVKTNHWFIICTQTPRCTSPEWSICDNCPEQCTLDGVPRYCKGINGDGSKHEE